MSLGNNNNDNSKLFILKIKVKDAAGKETPPTFVVSEKNQETGKWAATGSVSSVSGTLSRIDIKDNEWEGQHYNTISLYFKDDVLDETYLVDGKLNMLNRSIYNSLLNLKSFEDVKIGLYTSKKGYASAAVRQGGEMVNWKYSLDEVPAPLEVMFKGKIQRDYTPTDDFFIGKLKELAARLNSGGAEASKPAPKTKTTKKKEVTKAKEEELVESGNSIPEDDLF